MGQEAFSYSDSDIPDELKQNYIHVDELTGETQTGIEYIKCGLGLRLKLF